MADPGPPDFSAARIQGILSERGIDATKTEISDVLQNIDQQAIKDDELSKYVIEEWDKSSPINGVPADEMLARDGVPSDKPIYLINDAATGNVIFFQYVVPHVGGHLGSDWNSKANDHVDEIANRGTLIRVAEEVISRL